MKYCPNCLRECSLSKLHTGGYACEPCGVLQYCNGILLDTPDKEKQKEYQLENLLNSRVSYAYNGKDVAKEVLDLLSKFSTPNPDIKSEEK